MGSSVGCAFLRRIETLTRVILQTFLRERDVLRVGSDATVLSLVQLTLHTLRAVRLILEYRRLLKLTAAVFVTLVDEVGLLRHHRFFWHDLEFLHSLLELLERRRIHALHGLELRLFAARVGEDQRLLQVMAALQELIRVEIRSRGGIVCHDVVILKLARAVISLVRLLRHVREVAGLHLRYEHLFEFLSLP